MNEPPRLRTARALLGAFFALCLLALVWPGLAWAQALGPATLFGLPFAFGWSVAWVVATFVALALYDRALERAIARGSD